VDVKGTTRPESESDPIHGSVNENILYVLFWVDGDHVRFRFFVWGHDWLCRESSYPPRLGTSFQQLQDTVSRLQLAERAILDLL